ncbi:glycosyltransferase family 4 protein [Thiomonas sp.]|uniref:glycosyltransferase family 4 protein n=1 Tax=Thiomonas sp. TaxID=2047785 RepID=UPI0025832728|nr:glycosyltransferase family 4 protein [Thiomonas sp.]
MTVSNERKRDFGLALLNLSAWIRSQPWLRAFYRCFPESLRFRILQLLTARANRSVRFERTDAWRCQAAPPAARVLDASASVPGVPGVNVFAYARGQFGLAEAARLYTRALLSAGCRVAMHDITLDLAHSMGDTSLDGHIGDEAPHPINLIFVNPDYMDGAIECIGRGRFEGRYNIGCWFWELEKLPDEWLPALADVDEILVSSGFVADIVRRVTDKPVLHVPLPVIEQPDSGLQRKDFGLGDKDFVFLCSFDFNSFVARKNPLATIESFRRAFADGREDVRLLVKSSNGYRHPDRLRELLNVAVSDRRIMIRDEVIDRSHVQALQRCADVFVSLHRAEGFGLGLAECMRIGKPVIATAWSGNMEFMTAENSCLVGYRMIPVGEGEYSHHHGQHWADPDIKEAAKHMRRLVEDRAFGARIGARAALDIQEALSPERVAGRLLERLRALESTRESTQSTCRQSTMGRSGT